MTYDEYKAQAEDLLKSGSYTRSSLSRALGISRVKLDMINDRCSIKSYPRPLNASQSAAYGRATGKIKWGDKFKLKGTPIF